VLIALVLALALDCVFDPKAPLSPLARLTTAKKERTMPTAGAPSKDLQVECLSTPATRTVVKTSTSPTREKVATAPSMLPVLVASARESRQQMVV
jgi:hypothetical protein